MKSIYIRNFIMSAGLVMISFFILGIAFSLIGRRSIVNENHESLSISAREISDTAALYFHTEEGLRTWDLRMIITILSATSGNHMFICDEEGAVVSCSDGPASCPHGNWTLSHQLIQNLRLGRGFDMISDLDGFYESTHYIVAEPIFVSGTGQPVGYVFVASDSSGIMDFWEKILIVFYLTATATLIVALIVSYITSVRQASPINEMVTASTRFANGDFSARVMDTNREDEIGALTVSFNAMAEELEKSEELRREFIANVSHELKTPMTTISGFADGLLDGTIPKESQETYLAVISSETKRLSRLVRRMLELSQTQAAEPDTLVKRQFDLSETLRRTLLSFESKITERGLDVDISLPENPVLVLGEEDSITQVVYNLLDNAVKFAGPDTAIEISLWKQGMKACASIKNQGKTIPASELQYIFDRFHKTDRSRSLDREGMGLGLYLVKTILNSHGEGITVSSGGGITEFIFSLTLG